MIERVGALPSGAPLLCARMRADGLEARWLNFGATLMDWRAPDGTPLVMGFAEAETYLREHPFVGATVGRVANRIAGGRFEVDGERFQVTTTENGNALHSAPDGFDQQVWAMEVDGGALVMRHRSPAGHQGYPGAVEVVQRVTLEGGELTIAYEATTDAATPMSLTSHTYFTLGAERVDALEVRLPAESYAVVDGELIPTGEMRAVHDAFDLRARQALGARELDHSFNVPGDGVAGDGVAGDGLREVAVLAHGGHEVAVSSTLPAVQIYTGDALGEHAELSGAELSTRGGLALEPHFPPDAVNQIGFGDVILRPDEVWRHSIVYAWQEADA